MKRLVPCVLFCALALSFIGGRVGSVTGRGEMQSRSERDNDQHAQALAPNNIDPVVEQWSNFVAARQTTTHFAYTGAGDHENAGVYTAGGGSYLGVEALHTVFETGNFDLPIPAGAQGAQTLYAPTTRPPNGACLEVGTAYTTLPGRTTTVYVYVFDFCSSPKRFVKQIAVDDKFMDTYAGESINGVRAYKIRIVPDTKSLTSQTKWSAKIYDYVKQQWFLLGVGQGYVASDYNGWSIFETWYKKGQCSKTLKSLGALHIAYYDVLSDTWDPISDKMRDLKTTLHQGGNCFMDQDTNNLASYSLSRLQSEHGWKVTGTGK
jgi:hypothetical protein